MQELQKAIHMVEAHNAAMTCGLAALRKSSSLHVLAQQELNVQQSGIDWMVMMWQKNFICNDCVDGRCQLLANECPKIHCVCSHSALRDALLEAQTHKTMLCGGVFSVLLQNATENNYRCLELLRNLVQYSGKYLWPVEWEESQKWAQ
jgi:hypothetical protein